MTTWNALPVSTQTIPLDRAQDLLAAPTAAAAAELAAHEPIDVFEIDPDHADTAALSEAYGLDDSVSANCVLVAGTRAGEERIAACVVLASTKADVNKRVKKLLDVRKCSFMPMARAVEESGMEYGGIGPLGLPENYRILIDERAAAAREVILGSGIRSSKIITTGRALASFPRAEVITDLAIEVA